MRFLLRCLAGTLSVLLVLVLLSPWLVYEAGLYGVGRPTKPTQLATLEQQATAWHKAHGTGAPHVEVMNPYGFVFELIFMDQRARNRSGEPDRLLTYWVAREQMAAQPQRSMLQWHLSNAALMIWLTRHWSTEEIASAAFDITKDWKDGPRRPPADPQP